MGFLQDLLGFNPKHQAALERRAKGDTLAMQAHTTARSAARGAGAVSYPHLTLPTTHPLSIPLGALPLKKTTN